MKSLLVHRDDIVAAWAYTTYNRYPLPVIKTLGVMNSEGHLVGAALFENYNSINCDLSYYGRETLTVGIVRYIAYIAAIELNVARVTVVTSQKNKSLIRALLKIGFRLEGVQRRFYGHQDNRTNTGVRLVIFREKINQIAKLPTKEDSTN